MQKSLANRWSRSFVVTSVAFRTPWLAAQTQGGRTRNFHEKYRKKATSPKVWTTQNTPRKEKRKKKNYFPAVWGHSLRDPFQIFWAGGILSAFFVEIPGLASKGLCSRPGRAQCRAKLVTCSSFLFFCCFFCCSCRTLSRPAKSQGIHCISRCGAMGVSVSRHWVQYPLVCEPFPPWRTPRPPLKRGISAILV